MSSSSVLKTNRSSAISVSIVSRPWRIAAASAAEMMPCAASIAACARDPAISSRHSLRSKPIDALIRCIIEDGPALKRPPHRLFAPAVAGVEEEDLVMADISIAYSRKISWQACRPGAPIALGLALLCAPALAEDPVGKVGELIETKPAKPVPELTLTDLAQEQPANLDAYKGKALIVNLWATWCGPCVTEMPSLAKLADRLKDQGVVVAISEDRGGKF